MSDSTWVTCLLQGDRVGICLTHLDATLVDRGVACRPGAGRTFTGAIAAVDKIRFYVGHMPSKLKVHVTVGHQTVMGEVQFFGLPDRAVTSAQEGADSVMSRMDALTVKVVVMTLSPAVCTLSLVLMLLLPDGNSNCPQEGAESVMSRIAAHTVKAGIGNTVLLFQACSLKLNMARMDALNIKADVANTGLLCHVKNRCTCC